MVNLTVRKVGNSLGVILPAEAAAFLKVKEGDELFLTESPDGYTLTPYDPHFEKVIRLAEDFIDHHKNALRELAK
jgi:putative addiction module antidote